MPEYNILKFSEIVELEVNFHNGDTDKFSLVFDEEPKSFEFVNCSDAVAHSSEYIRLREEAWLRKKNILDGFLWNGILLSVVSLRIKNKRVFLTISKCEYKDVIYKSEKGVDVISKLHPQDFIDVHAFTAALPVIHNESILLSVVGRGTIFDRGLLDMIGGSLNVDEEKIEHLKDVLCLTLKELSEEINLAVDPAQVSIFSINFYEKTFFFLYRFNLECVEMLQNFERNDEVDSLAVHEINDRNLNSENSSADLIFAQHTFKYLCADK